MDQINQIRFGNRHILKIKIRKLNKLFLVIFCIPLFFLPVLIIRIIRPIVVFRFGYLESSGIGHFSKPTDLYLCEVDKNIHLDSNVVNFDIWCFEPKISNRFLAKKWKKYYRIFPWFLILPIINVNKLFPGYRRHEVPYRYIHDKHQLPWQYQDFYEVYNKSKCHIHFTQKEIKKSNELLKKINILPQDKIVSFIVRDIAFHGFCSDNYRNSDIKIVEPAMEVLATLNYKVLRMGQKVMSPLSIKHKNIIDYTNSSIYSEMLDIFIVSKCKFFIDTGTGLSAVASMFRRPTLFINYSELHYLCLHPTDLFIPKHFWSIELKRMLNFREIIKIKAHYFSDDIHYKKAKIEAIDNTPEEISGAVIEMEKRINKNWIVEKDECKLQNKLKEIWNVEEKKGVSIPNISYNFLIENRDYLN